MLLRGHHLQQHLLQELHLHLHRLLQHRYERGRGLHRTPPSILAAPFTTHLGSPPLADLFEYKFINSRVLNSTFLHNKEGCQLDFSDDNNAYMIYFVSFLGTLAVLPGNIVSALLMDKIGRLRMLGGHPQFHPHQVFFFWVLDRGQVMLRSGTSGGELWPVLGSPAQKGWGGPGMRSAEGHKGVIGPGASSRFWDLGVVSLGTGG